MASLRRFSAISHESDSKVAVRRGSLPVTWNRDDYETCVMPDDNSPIVQLEQRLFAGQLKDFLHATLWSQDERFGGIRYKIHYFLMHIYVRIFAVLLSLGGIILGVCSLKVGVENVLELIRVNELRARDNDANPATNTTSNLAEETIKKLENALPLITDIANAIFGNPHLSTIYDLTFLIIILFFIEFLLKAFTLRIFTPRKIFTEFHRDYVMCILCIVILFLSGVILKYFERVSCILLFFVIFVHSLSHSLPLSLRYMASKGRTRFIRDGFDLDLTYITPQVIAMSFPSSGVGELGCTTPLLDGDLALRNPLREVADFFIGRHGEKFHIYKGVDIINGEYPPGVFFKGSQMFGQKNKGSQIFREKYEGSQINFRV